MRCSGYLYACPPANATFQQRLLLPIRPAPISKQVPRKERKGEGTEPAASIGARRVPRTGCDHVSVQCGARRRSSRPGACVSVPLPCVLLLETARPLAQGRDARAVSVSPRTRKRLPEQGEETSRRGDSSEPAVVLDPRVAKRSATPFQQARAARRGLPGSQRPTRSLLFLRSKRRRETAEEVEPLPPADDDFTLRQPQPRLQRPPAPGADGRARRVAPAASTEPALGKDRPVRRWTEGFVPAGRSVGGWTESGAPGSP